MAKNIILVRSAQELIEKDLVGYGWENVKFENYGDGKDLIKRGFKANGIDIGRKRKQIERYQNIKEGDIVVVPVNRAIAIGIATNNKDYEENSTTPYSANRIIVNFFTKESKVIYVLRSALDMNFEQRLKIRTTIANLNDFDEEINQVIEQIKAGKNYKRGTVFANKEKKAKDNFIEEMLKRMRTGKGLGIAAGGSGLEELIKEIFQAKGYEAFIPPKNKKNSKNKHIADVDIVAYKNGELSTKGELILIQAKHHKGTTSDHGVKQLEAMVDYSFGKNGEFSEDDYAVKKILITTAKKDIKNNNSIQIINGQLFVEWLYENIDLLDKKTKEQLGVSEVPTLV